MSQSKLVEVDALIAANPDDQDLQQLRDDILQLIAKEQESAVPSAAASIDAGLPSIASAPTDIISQDEEAVIIHDEEAGLPSSAADESAVVATAGLEQIDESEGPFTPDVGGDDDMQLGGDKSKVSVVIEEDITYDSPVDPFQIDEEGRDSFHEMVKVTPVAPPELARAHMNLHLTAA